MDIDKLTSIDQLRENQKELAEILGIEAYKRLIKHYGGMPIYVQKADSVMKDTRDIELNEKFDGSNYKELAREYGISEMTIRDIVAPKRRELKIAPLKGQLSFDNE